MLRLTETPEPDLIHETGCKEPSLRHMFFYLKMVVRPKHVADKLNKIVNNY
jgi:hypothetical protein